jgi:hypothetical protein
MDELLQQPFRPPAVPLVTHDPYFSCWSFSDHLTDDWPRHWTGAQFSLFGAIRVDQAFYRFLGGAVFWEGTAHQLSLEVKPTRTIYQFECGPVLLRLTFTSTLLLDDLELLSRPVTYLGFEVKSLDGQSHDVRLYLDCSGEWVVNQPSQMVTWERSTSPRLDSLNIFSTEQNLLKNSGDDRRIDWGRMVLSAPKGSATMVAAEANAARETFALYGELPAQDWERKPRPANSWGGAVLAALIPLGKVGGEEKSVHLLLGYDDEYAIEYFHQPLRAWWRRVPGANISQAMDQADRDYDSIIRRCEEFDEHLTKEARRVGNEAYARLLGLAYRQAVAAHKLVASPDGRPFFLSKENNSNGCICTVDVTYPSAPLFLYYNPILLKGMLDPIFDYCRSDQWHFPFAAHDLGTYPLANGQVYGKNRIEDQMPVEECGNMIILTMAIVTVEQDSAYARRHWDLLTRWAEYLLDHGLDPENQLCTDDFAGHFAHNVNLSAKAIVALGCYGKMAAMLGEPEIAAQYQDAAGRFAQEWERMADNGDHYRLAFDQPGSWSQKYNLVWDKLLGLNLFDPQIAAKELAYYGKRINRYGLPLDQRRNYTKSDWILWCAAMTDNQETFDALVNPVYRYAQETSSRVPLSDWHDTINGRHIAFKARSVVGGYFMKLLADKLNQ